MRRAALGARPTRASLRPAPTATTKRAWYAAEQNLRNQLDRTYEAEMDFTLDELTSPGPGKGVANPPDIDARAWLLTQVKPKKPPAPPPPDQTGWPSLF